MKTVVPNLFGFADLWRGSRGAEGMVPNSSICVSSGLTQMEFTQMELHAQAHVPAACTSGAVHACALAPFVRPSS